MTTSHPIPELLAPAGSWEAFFAGLDAGADAFYLGLRQWSARGRARNFDLDDLARLTPLAHEHDRKVYVALNTLIKEVEFPQVVSTLWELSLLGVDGIILQDLGIWNACHHLFPELRLHASTQMTVHNAAGVRQLERMGFSRAVLARECTVAEIAAIGQHSDLELEVFVHGALCYSISGMCMASSMLSGGSANRGWCAQPCRWKYKRSDSERIVHPFSTTDLCLVEHIGDLQQAGVCSLKLEGRLKGAEYVHNAVRAYRKVLDADPGDRDGALGAAREILRKVASRPPTTGYATHARPKEVLLKGGRPTVGTWVGKVSGWRRGTVTIKAKTQLSRGDRIRIADDAGGDRVALTLRDFRSKKSGEGSRIEVECPTRVRTGASVYLTKTAAEESYVQGLTKRIPKVSQRRQLPVGLSVAVDADRIEVAVSCGPLHERVSVPIVSYPAERHPLDPGTLHKHLGRLGQTNYRLEHLEVRGELPQVVIPPSVLKEVRNSIVSALNLAQGRRRASLPTDAEPLRVARPAPSADHKRLWLRVERLGVLWAAVEQSFHRVLLPMNKEFLRARDRIVQKLGGRDRIVWEPPPWIAQGELEIYRKKLEVLAREGFREVLVSNLGHLDLVAGRIFGIHAGRELHVLNGWSAAALEELGCQTVTPSPETDGENLREISRQGWPAKPVVYTFGNLPWFTTRLDLSVLLKKDTPLSLSDGTELRSADVPKPLGQAWARAHGNAPFCWSHRMGELREMGIGDFLFDFQGRTYGSHELGIICKKFRTERPLRDTAEGNFSRGLK